MTKPPTSETNLAPGGVASGSRQEPSGFAKDLSASSAAPSGAEALRMESAPVRYRTIVADPPWEIGAFPANLHVQNGGTNPVPYGTMPLDEIKALPVREWAAVEAHLYLWTTAGYLRDAYVVAEAWGFEAMYPLIWCKASKGRGLGGKFQSNVEFCLFCRDREGALRITTYLADAAEAAGRSRRDIDAAMGTSDMAGWWLSRLPHRAKVPTWEQWLKLKELVGFDDRYDDEIQGADEERRADRRCNTRWWEWPRGAHSAKPEAFLDIVESVSPGPYLEMFARRARFGWDYYGNESLETVAA